MRLANMLSLHERSRNARLQRDQGAVDRAGRGEGAEIIAGLVARAAMLGQLREIVVAGEVDVGERLVVAQQHVVARHQALDQVAFEQQRLDLGVGDDDLERARSRPPCAAAGSTDRPEWV